MLEVTCPRCGTRFGCGASAPGCWCRALPPLVEPDPGLGCYCPACLRTLSARSGMDGGAPSATGA
ncbi:MAG: cysteine-rich CWC family protein [Betaproteobacteria bacterium]|nr:cysteine-rich CWC family protein [Betaproteobacteria bacterium]